MMKKQKLILFSGLFLVLGCSNIKLRYEAEVEKTQGKESGRFIYENHYSTGSLDILCPLTVIFMGGACWYYVVMPTTYQQDQCVTDAQKVIASSKEGQKLKVKEYRVQNLGWGKVDEPKATVIWEKSKLSIPYTGSAAGSPHSPSTD